MTKIEKHFLDYNFFEKKYFDEKKNGKIDSELLFHKKKYKFFIKELTYRFNSLLNKNYSEKFWNIVIGKFIFYHLHQCQEIYNSFNNIVNLYKKKTKIINPKFYKTPSTMVDYQNFIQCCEMGRQQIFSILIKEKIINSKILYYKNKFVFPKIKKEVTSRKIDKKLTLLFKRIRNYIYRKIKKPNMLISGCIWSFEERIDIQYKSYGKIKADNFYIPEKKKIRFNKELRDQIFSSKKYSNNFDKFFFETLKYCCPLSIFENLNYRISKAETYLDQHKNLKYILNENLSEDNLTLLGVAKNKNIKLIYCEHNTLAHQYKQNWTLFITNLFDYYFTLGWKDKSKKFFAGGSLFPWIKVKNYKQSIKKKILFIPTLPIKRTLFNSSIYGEDSFNNENYYNINKLFFSNIDEKISKEIVYKKYPNIINLDLSDHENKIDELVKNNKITIIDNSKRLIDKDFENSKLIVVNYLKTSLIQSLKSNIPTVIFYNNKSYSLKRKYKNFFKDLNSASIIHKNPILAAKFVNKIGYDPYKWWNSKKTKKAREKFILKNLKSGSDLKKLILNFV